MKSQKVSTIGTPGPKPVASFRPLATAREGELRRTDQETINSIFGSIGQKLREGRSSEAERVLTNAIQNHQHTDDDLANLKRLLAFTLETVGRYKESLDTVKHYENEAVLARLSPETKIRVITQLAISYNNLGDHPKAVTLLKETYERAKVQDFHHLIGSIETGLARVYRKLNECPISRDHAERGLAAMRDQGDWLGMAEAYREIALSYHQEGNSEKSVEYFDLGVQIIGDRSAPFMLGKLYTDLSGAYWFLRRPHDGIACLEKSIVFFEQTEHVLNSVIAYNNLGIHLLHIGNWEKAEEMILRALDLAKRSEHVHVAGILDSLGELNILRGDTDEARALLEQAVAVAREKKREWYEAQAMRNLSRCLLAEGKYEEAADMARKTIELCRQIGDKHYANMAGLVLAEGCLETDNAIEAENALEIVEENDPNADFFVVGNIQRIKGLLANLAGDRDLAVHHFNRCLTTFEAAEDVYHTGLANLLLGQFLPEARNGRALKHLTTAAQIFGKLRVESLVQKANAEITKRRQIAETAPTEIGSGSSQSVVSQLLMVRLAEATASRELLFREVVAVLQQESQAKKILIAVRNENKQIVPFITHGYTSDESTSLIRKFQQSADSGDEKAFARSKNVAVFSLKPTNASPATLMVSPKEGALLNDGSHFQPLLRVVELGMDVIALRERNRPQPVEEDASPYTSSSMMPGFIHSSPAMTSLVEEVYKIRSSDVTVLVTGESGTGKELVSRAIHKLSNRKDKVFIPFNCTAIPKELAEGHLFGYRKGAFTGAVTDSPGMIRAADGGTLFLDEIGDLPLEVQPKLLRFLQEGEVQPIGEKRPIKVDVRVIAATNMPLEAKVADGSFREDLYYRLNVIRLRVPPLKERRSEIPPIINYYINHYSSRFNKRDIVFSPQTVDLLMVCEWEGNVRQLCNEIQRIIARAVDGDTITPDDLSPELKRSARPLTPFAARPNSKVIASFDQPVMPFANISEGGTLEQAVSELEMQMIRTSLSRNNWNISRVAGELGLTRRGLYLKLSRYGIQKAA
jgi:DNA-binding NtrC family response regulator/tetratricopeptide (TPR) repeat protein